MDVKILKFGEMYPLGNPDTAWLALATGVGRRFVIDLEAGKPSCQLGRSLLVAKALGLDLAILASDACSQSATAPELPEVAEEEEPDGHSIRIL